MSKLKNPKKSKRKKEAEAVKILNFLFYRKMGNSIAKFRKVNWVDGGRVKEKLSEAEQPIMTDAWGAPIYAPKDYDNHLVKKLIRQRRLAPFYAAEEGEPSDMMGSDEDSFSDSSGPKKQMKKVKKNRPNKDDPEFIESSFFDADLLFKDLIDCPICLLAYPRNINYTECCHQPMCTLCFVKIKRPSSGRIISCPYCNHVNFAVCYHKPRWLSELEKAEGERDEGIRPDPVACEAVKACSAQMERIQRLQQQQQQQRQPRYYYANPQRSSSINGPRRYVFYEPSGSYTFYDNQYYRNAPAEGLAVSTPSYYQHYQQQEFQRQQALRTRAEAYERNQLDEAIRRSMDESGDAAEQYALVNNQR